MNDIPCSGIFLKDIEVRKGIEHWLKSTAILGQEGPLGIPLTRLIKETGKHLLGTLAAAVTLPPPFLLCHRSQESTEGGRISVATNSSYRVPPKMPAFFWHYGEHVVLLL